MVGYRKYFFSCYHRLCLLLQQNISSVQAWCQTWNLPLNISKCNALTFALAQHQDSYQYLLDNAKIQITKIQRDLGVIETIYLGQTTITIFTLKPIVF